MEYSSVLREAEQSGTEYVDYQENCIQRAMFSMMGRLRKCHTLMQLVRSTHS